MPGAKAPWSKFSHMQVSPRWQVGHGSSPRTWHGKKGLTTTRCPAATPAWGPASTTRATTSWPRTAGKETRGERAGLFRPVIVPRSLPQIPARMGTKRTQSGPGRGRRGRVITPTLERRP